MNIFKLIFKVSLMSELCAERLSTCIGSPNVPQRTGFPNSVNESCQIIEQKRIYIKTTLFRDLNVTA